MGIDYPIIQAPIGSATTAELAAAVSNAGALGTLSLTWRSRHEAQEILGHTSSLTRRPFGVNLVLTSPQEDRLALALDAGVRIIWTFWGEPHRHAASVHAAGGLLLHTVGSVEEAVDAAAAGIDVLILQGVEAGGHVRGTRPARELLAQTREQVPKLPLVVAGGIANGRDIGSSLAAGAAGVCLGTRFLCSREANVAPIYQQAILDASDGDTLLTGLFDKGWPNAPHRVLCNSTVRMWQAAGCPPAGSRPGEHEEVARTAAGAAIERYSDVIPTRDVAGDLEALALYAGETSARIHDILFASEIVQQLLREAAEVPEAAQQLHPASAR